MFPDVIFYCRTIGSGVVKIRKILNRYEQFYIIIKKTIVAYVQLVNKRLTHKKYKKLYVLLNTNTNVVTIKRI